ncbi:MAG: arylesterase [Alcaligenaceae bacterium]|nr:MAG: arylesterase [Alcaligenaceae bacterium]
MNPFSCSRRRLIVCLAGLCLHTSPQAAAQGQPLGKPHRILVVGDSLSAEYGLARNTGWVVQLKVALANELAGTTVANASISGDTTSGGVTRLDAALKQHRPTIVLLELGANDALRGLPLTLTQKNLIDMSQRAKAAGAKVVLIGMQIPPNYGRDYAQGFKNVFVQTAAQTDAALVPFLLEGFADQKQYFQADGIHPNENAQSKMLATVRKILDPLLH